MIKDLTVVYLTASSIPEGFANYVRKTLIEAIGDTALISVSRKPLDFGHNLLDTEKRCTDNIYRQMLRAAKEVKTKYFAVAEDDVLYPPEHFVFWRPADDEVLYNKNRLLLFTWDNPMYHWRDRLSNATLIAPTELLIEALEERYRVWPDGVPERLVGEVGRAMVERNLHITERKCLIKYSKTSVIHFNHANASELRQQKKRKSYGPLRSYDIPHWGKAADLVKIYEL